MTVVRKSVEQREEDRATNEEVRFGADRIREIIDAALNLVADDDPYTAWELMDELIFAVRKRGGKR